MLALGFVRDERLVEGELLDELLLVLLQLTHVTRRLRDEVRDDPRDQEDKVLQKNNPSKMTILRYCGNYSHLVHDDRGKPNCKYDVILSGIRVLLF